MDAASGVSSHRLSAIARERRDTLLADAINFPWEAMTESIGVADLGDDFRQNPRTDIPTLFISGTLDGRTPPENAAELLEGFPNGRHLILHGAGHGDPLFVASPRIAQVMLAFLKGEPVANETVQLAPIRFVH